MDQFWSAPPVTRTITALTFAQSALVYGGLLSGYYIVFLPELVFRILPEIWRLGSPFLMTGPGLSFLFDLYFMYTYGSSLETSSPRFSSPGDFFTYVFFVATMILSMIAEAVPGSEEDHPCISYTHPIRNPFGLYAVQTWWEYLEIASVIKQVHAGGCLLNSVIFTSALILAFVYTFAQDNRGRKATFFVIQIPIEYLPWAMLALTLVLGGWPSALRDSTGIVAAHMYDFLTRIYPTFGGGRNYIITPGFVRRFFNAYSPREAYRSYGTAYQPRGQPRAQLSTPSNSGGWTPSFQSRWSGMGPGRRLGGG